MRFMNADYSDHQRYLGYTLLKTTCCWQIGVAAWYELRYPLLYDLLQKCNNRATRQIYRLHAA